MAYRELSVVEIREMLRLWKAGHGYRKVAAMVGVDRKTVRRHVEAAVAAGLSREGPSRDVDDDLIADVVAVIHPGGDADVGEMRRVCRAHAKRIEDWLDEGCRGPKIVKLMRRHTGVPVPLRTLQRFIREEIGPQRDGGSTVRIVDPPPGKTLEVDFMVLGEVVIDGKRVVVHALLCVASRSRHMFVWPCLGTTFEDLVEGLEAAWAFFGGVFWVIVPDNMPAVVAKADPLKPKITAAFFEYAQSRDFAIDATRTRSPRDKARVERTVSYVRDDYFKGERFLSLADMQRRAVTWCLEDAGRRCHGTIQRQPIEAFETEELPVLKPAPTEPYDQPAWVSLKVGRDHAVTVAQALYSVPYRYRGETLRVRYDRSTVKFYADGILVKIHPRVGRGQSRIDALDLPPGLGELATRDAESLQARAQRAGPSVGEYARRLLDGELPWTRFRHVYRLLGLCRRYGPRSVDAACQRALELDVVDVLRIDRMLARGVLGSPPPTRPKPQQKVIELRFARHPSEFRTRRGGPDAS